MYGLYGDSGGLLMDQCLRGVEILESTTRALLEAFAGAADSGALDSDQARQGAAALAGELLRSTSKVAIPLAEPRLEAYFEASKLIESFATALAES
jgi:hypothetical protein